MNKDDEKTKYNSYTKKVQIVTMEQSNCAYKHGEQTKDQQLKLNMLLWLVNISTWSD